MKNSVEGLLGGSGVNQDRVHQRNLGKGSSFSQGSSRGRSKQSPRIDTDQTLDVKLGRSEREAEEVDTVVANTEYLKTRLFHGEQAAEGLDEAASLDVGEVSGDVLVGDVVGRRDHGLGVVEGLAGVDRVVEVGEEGGVDGVLSGVGLLWFHVACG